MEKTSKKATGTAIAVFVRTHEDITVITGELRSGVLPSHIVDELARDYDPDYQEAQGVLLSAKDALDFDKLANAPETIKYITGALNRRRKLNIKCGCCTYSQLVASIEAQDLTDE